jgi:glycosyltransferase involved in cell wall biosynthesis
MRIGMILDKEFPPDPRVANEAQTLIDAGFDVRLFCLNFKSEPKSEEINNLKINRFSMSKLFYDKFSPLVYTFPFFSLKVRDGIRNFIDANKPDVIHIHDMVIAEAVFKINKQHRLPIVLDLHENRPEIMKTYSHINKGIGKLLINLEKWERKQREFIEKADRVIVVTQEAKEDLLNECNISSGKIIVVPNTVNLNIFLSYPISYDILDKYKDDFVVLYLGSTGLRRGLDTAIKAVRFLKDKIPNLKLVIVGKSRDDKILMDLSENLGVKNQVVFEGWRDESLFPSYIRASKICISPLTRNRHHDTTYANKIFQYMSCGKPIIVSDCKAQKRIVEENQCGLVYKAGDHQDLADKIFQLYIDQNIQRSFGQNSLKAIFNKYQWNFTSKELVELYRKYERI